MEEEALLRHKQGKKQAYIKYLRNNLHDKYEQIKRNQKVKNTEVVTGSKWKKKSKEEQTNLDALDLEVPHNKSNDQPFKNQPKNPQKEQKKIISYEFQRQWQEQSERYDDMIGSKLLDSLDLDSATLGREFEIKGLEKQKLNKQKTALDEMKNLIGYESILIEIDEKISQKKNIPKNNVFPPQPNGPIKKQLNEGEVFNELKNKKEGKLLFWAIEQEIEADDLFSNCTSKKSASKTLKEINEELKNKRLSEKEKPKIHKELEPIVEIKQTKPLANNRNRPFLITKSKEKSQKIIEQERKNEYDSSEKIKPKTATSLNASNERKKSVTKPVPVPNESNKSIEKKKSPKIESNKQIKMPIAPNFKTQQKYHSNTQYKQQYQQAEGTVATFENQFEIDSFIKNELVNLNDEQKKIQAELRDLHLNNKAKLKQVEGKYNIRTDFKHSYEITGDEPVKYEVQSQEAIFEESIQRLDDILLRREMKSREKPEEQKSEIRSLKSIINPLANPIELHKQILELADNLSKFEKQPIEEEGYGAKMRSKQKKDISKKPVEQANVFACEDLVESKTEVEENESNRVLDYPPKMLYDNFKKNKFIESNESDEAPRQKVCVNERLRNLLLDD